MESQINRSNNYDNYIEWIEFSQLENIQEASPLNHECTHIADWQEPTVKKGKTTRIILKKIADGQNSQTFDFHQVNSHCNTVVLSMHCVSNII